MTDTVMADAVYEVLLQTYLKKREGDVHMKAAERVAIDLLNDAWRELDRYKKEMEREPKENHNPGI